jgi:hypothetical protein
MPTSGSYTLVITASWEENRVVSADFALGS